MKTRLLRAEDHTFTSQEIDFAIKYSPYIILMDFELSILTRIEATKEIKKNNIENKNPDYNLTTREKEIFELIPKSIRNKDLSKKISNIW